MLYISCFLFLSLSHSLTPNIIRIYRFMNRCCCGGHLMTTISDYIKWNCKRGGITNKKKHSFHSIEYVPVKMLKKNIIHFGMYCASLDFAYHLRIAAPIQLHYIVSAVHFGNISTGEWSFYYLYVAKIEKNARASPGNESEQRAQLRMLFSLDEWFCQGFFLWSWITISMSLQ